MTETIVLALVTSATGLGGALIGAFASLHLERQRRSGERVGVTNTIRMDIIRWSAACRSMSEDWNVRVHLGQALPWSSVAPLATVHLPPGVSAMLFQLYLEREQTESAYEELRKGIPEPKMERAYYARFGLRRWSMMAQSLLQEWDRYVDRPRATKLTARWAWSDRLDRAGPQPEKQTLDRMLKETRELLAGTYGYKLGEHGELLEENHSAEAYESMRAEYAAAVGRTPSR